MVWQKWEDAEDNIVELKSGKLKKLYFTHFFIDFLLFDGTNYCLFVFLWIQQSQSVTNKEKSDSRWNLLQPVLWEKIYPWGQMECHRAIWKN